LAAKKTNAQMLTCALKAN